MMAASSNRNDGGTGQSPVGGASDFSISLAVHRCDASVRMIRVAQPSLILVVAGYPTFMSLQEAIHLLLRSCPEERIAAMRVAHSPSTASFDIVVMVTDRDAAESIQAALHHHRISTLSVEQLTVVFLAPPQEDSERTLDALFPIRGLPGPRGGSPVSGESLLQEASAPSARTCPICMESLDQTAVISLPCGHHFDLHCFVRVDEGVCPLCRFNIGECNVACAECDAVRDIWMCLACGTPHCGRAASGHMTAHHRRYPSHRYAIQVGGARVWDFSADALVHRVINTDDGGFVGVAEEGGAPPRASWFDLMEEDEDSVVAALIESRTDAIAAAYNAILQDQLAVQHEHFLSLVAPSALLRRVEAAEVEGRVALCIKYADTIRQLVRQSLQELQPLISAQRSRLRQARSQLDMADATVSALRVNVSKLRETRERLLLSSSSDAVARDNSTSTAPTPEDVARLEQRLADLYTCFDR